jgi:hypothetical protein
MTARTAFAGRRCAASSATISRSSWPRWQAWSCSASRNPCCSAQSAGPSCLPTPRPSQGSSRRRRCNSTSTIIHRTGSRPILPGCGRLGGRCCWSWPMGTPWSCGSGRWPSGWATPLCGCWATTARSPARRSRSPRAQRSSSTSSTRATWTPPCTGMGCGWRTATTGCRTRPRPRSRWGASSPTGSSSPTPGCTGTTPTSARTTARSWACTATSWWCPPTPTTGRRWTGSWC